MVIFQFVTRGYLVFIGIMIGYCVGIIWIIQLSKKNVPRIHQKCLGTLWYWGNVELLGVGGVSIRLQSYPQVCCLSMESVGNIPRNGHSPLESGCPFQIQQPSRFHPLTWPHNHPLSWQSTIGFSAILFAKSSNLLASQLLVPEKKQLLLKFQWSFGIFPWKPSISGWIFPWKSQSFNDCRLLAAELELLRVWKKGHWISQRVDGVIRLENAAKRPCQHWEKEINHTIYGELI